LFLFTYYFPRQINCFRDSAAFLIFLSHTIIGDSTYSEGGGEEKLKTLDRDENEILLLMRSIAVNIPLDSVCAHKNKNRFVSFCARSHSLPSFFTLGGGYTGYQPFISLQSGPDH